MKCLTYLIRSMAFMLFAAFVPNAAQGGSFEASVMAAGISAIHAGAVDPERALRDERQAIAIAELFGGLGAAVVSGGDLNATMIGAGVAGSAFENNYLTHAEEEEFSRNLVACESQGSAAACERLNELRTLSDERDAQLQGCVGDYSGQCVRARWQLTQTAAEYYELGATGQSLGVLDERALLARHMVFLDAFAYADDLDANLRVDLGLLGPDYSSDAAQIIATGTQSEIEQAIIDPIALGVATFGGEFSPERRSGDNGTGANGGAGAANNVLTPITNVVDLTGGRRGHILNGHLFGAGKSGKTEFPQSWDADRIMHQVSDVATDPNATRGVGKWASPYATGVRDGIEIRVDFYPDFLPSGLPHPNAGKISTAYPTNTPVNP